MIRIHLNGEARALEDTPTLEKLLFLLEIPSLPVAIAVNNEVIPRAQYPTTILHEGDKVEILRPSAGG